jgi:hypothetical protein
MDVEVAVACETAGPGVGAEDGQEVELGMILSQHGVGDGVDGLEESLDGVGGGLAVGQGVPVG